MFERFCDDRTPNSQRGIAVRRRRYGSPTRIKDILRGSAERQSSCEMLASDLNFRLRVRRIVPNRHTCFATSCTKDTRSPNASRRPNVVEFREASGLRRVHHRFWPDGGCGRRPAQHVRSPSCDSQSRAPGHLQRGRMTNFLTAKNGENAKDKTYERHHRIVCPSSANLLQVCSSPEAARRKSKPSFLFSALSAFSAFFAV